MIYLRFFTSFLNKMFDIKCCQARWVSPACKSACWRQTFRSGWLMIMVESCCVVQPCCFVSFEPHMITFAKILEVNQSRSLSVRGSICLEPLLVYICLLKSCYISIVQPRCTTFALNWIFSSVALFVTVVVNINYELCVYIYMYDQMVCNTWWACQQRICPLFASQGQACWKANSPVSQMHKYTNKQEHKYTNPHILLTFTLHFLRLDIM